MDAVAQNGNVERGIPEAARGLCWGGFFLNWIWAIGNRTWIGLLVFVPIIGVFMPFVLLFKGREWAWKNKQWKSVEHFNSTQRTWSILGVVLFCCVPVAGILAAIAIPNFQRFQLRAQQSEAKSNLLAIYSAEKLAQVTSGGSYTDDFDKLKVDVGNAKHYRFGFASSGPEFAEHCPDCVVNETAFKAVGFGKIGTEKKLDVWTIDQNKNLVHEVDGI